MTRHLSKLNPLYRKMSSAEENSALTVSAEDLSVIKIDITDPATFAMMQSNSQLEENFEHKLEGLSENELLYLFLQPEDEQKRESVDLVPSLIPSSQSEKPLSLMDYAISKRLEGLFNTGGAITREDFHNYGRANEGFFAPYWHDNESFESFAKRELGINRTDSELVGEAVDRLLLLTKVPLSDNDLIKLSTINDQLFTQEEIQKFLSHSILIEDDDIHALAVAMEEDGMIEAGSVQRITSPVEELKAQATDQKNAFYFSIVKQADAVYGAPNYFPKPSTDSELLADIKSIDVIPQDPKLFSLLDMDNMIWGATVRGESTNLGVQIQVRSLLGSVELVVLDTQSNELLTNQLLESTDLLRYMVGAKLIEIQREKMKELKYIFQMVEEQKIMDENSGKWPFAGQQKNLHKLL